MRDMFIKYSVVLFLLALCGGYLAVLKAEDRKCEQNWTYYNESCYIYLRNLSSWQKSQQACVSEQASLVTVNDQYEMNFIMTLLKGKGSWNGLHNNSHRNVFEWISGERSDYRYWHTDEPKISKTKRCVHMYQQQEHQWHMAFCGNKLRYMCEKAWKPCDSKPCQNRGTCVPNGNNYTCQCVAEFTGLQCEQGITATSTAVNVVIATSRPMEALSTTEVSMPTPGIPEVTQSSTVFSAQPHSVVISPSTSTEPTTSSSLEGPKVVPPYRKPEMTTAYKQPEMTTAYTQPEMTTSPPKSDPKSNPGEGQTDARQLRQSDGINVAAIVVPVVLLLLLIILVIIGYICYERNKKQKEKTDETVDMCSGDLALLQPQNGVKNSSGDLALLQPQNGVKNSPNEVPPLYQSKDSLQKSMDSVDSVDDYGEGGSFTEEYGDGKNATPDAKDKPFVAFV